MSCAVSENFISTFAAAADWRAVIRALLLDLVPRAGEFSLGFLYVTDHLAADTEQMLDLLRSETGVEHWVGTVGLGVFGNDGAGTQIHIDTPAASAMLARIPVDRFRILSSAAPEGLETWLETQDALLALVHGDSTAEGDPARALAEIGLATGGFLAGGLSASRTRHGVLADQWRSGGWGGVVFSGEVPVATTLSQGCAPLGPVHTVTRSDGHAVRELDGMRALDVFTRDITARAVQDGHIDLAPGAVPDIAVGTVTRELPDSSGPAPRDAGEDVVRHLFTGDVHIALPVPGSDQGDYMVRNLAGIDPESGCLLLSQAMEPGQDIMFVHRDEDAMAMDLSRALDTLRRRVTREQGRFAPQGAVYISCVSRMAGAGVATEQALLREVLGNIPLVGFYANGEISNQRLYAYTGVLVLFL